MNPLATALKDFQIWEGMYQYRAKVINPADINQLQKYLREHGATPEEINDTDIMFYCMNKCYGLAREKIRKMLDEIQRGRETPTFIVSGELGREFVELQIKADFVIANVYVDRLLALMPTAQVEELHQRDMAELMDFTSQLLNADEVVAQEISLTEHRWKCRMEAAKKK